MWLGTRPVAKDMGDDRYLAVVSIASINNRVRPYILPNQLYVPNQVKLDLKGIYVHN
jgi:hypothetical protein